MEEFFKALGVQEFEYVHIVYIDKQGEYREIKMEVKPE
jgi:hypothetical protein